MLGSYCKESCYFGSIFGTPDCWKLPFQGSAKEEQKDRFRAQKTTFSKSKDATNQDV